MSFVLRMATFFAFAAKRGFVQRAQIGRGLRGREISQFGIIPASAPCSFMLPDDLILIAEDNESDALILQRTFNLIGLGNRVEILSDGVEVIEYLSGAGKYADRARFPFPAVLFTDIKMPRVDGFELLQWLRRHPQYAVVPTIMFSGSGEAADVRRAYNLGANAYLVKPSSIEQLEKMMRRTYEFWGLCAETLTTGHQSTIRPEIRLCGMG